MSTVTISESVGTPLPITMTTQWDNDLRAGDPLGFPGYEHERAKFVGEAVRTGKASVGGVPCAYIESDFSVFGGSMGLVVGERVSRAFRRAADEQLPVVASIRTGGARMQEGMLSLIQMPRVVAAFNKHADAGLLSLGCLRSPTAGGMFASWASLLDLRAADSGATMGFAGPRVVAEMTGTPPPPTSHNAEAAYRAGLVDAVVAPSAANMWVLAALGAVDIPLALPSGRPAVLSGESMRDPSASLLRRSRAPRRPSGLEWAAALCDSWSEIKGADPAIRAGLASIAGTRCVVVAMDRHARGDAKARPGPEAYRLAQRAIRLAGKLSLPLLTLVDTPGAEPAPASEAGGIAREIAETLRCLDQLPTPSVCVCVGEGGSGGAIALAHADRMFMLEDSVFSVIGPEAAAVILWRDSGRAAEATSALRIASSDLIELGISDMTLPEPHDVASFELVRASVAGALDDSVPGQRSTRIDAAASRWLREGPLKGL